MPAIVIHQANDLRLEDHPAPPPGAGEVQVRITRGGICGSDLHYVSHGGFGSVRLAEPMILGHEVVGTVALCGPGVTGVTPGDAVAINPALPCGTCRFCRADQSNHCLDMRFFGSAMRRPHVQGAFRSEITVNFRQLVPLPQGLDPARAVFAEPLAVALHAVKRAGVRPGDRVIIAGMGPIGALILLAARYAGATTIVATDIAAEPLALARTLGADQAIKPDGLSLFTEDRGYFNIGFEASGAAAAPGALLGVVEPRGRIIQVGLGGDLPISSMSLVAKEIDICGAFRFTHEFDHAVTLLGAGAIDVAPLLTAVFPVVQASAAFALAADRSRAMKVQISF
ncbi:L-idonate 5-dehydrogenase [Acidiphilium sp.]|uniref:L-idonate 5-dehydrogenase n=1 Tax=Acidiphilium sp. TaxID=527 RepID=UPI003D01EA5A